MYVGSPIVYWSALCATTLLIQSLIPHVDKVHSGFHPNAADKMSIKIACELNTEGSTLG